MSELEPVVYYGREKAEEGECNGRGFLPGYPLDWYVQRGDYHRFIAEYSAPRGIRRTLSNLLRPTKPIEQEREVGASR